MKLSPVGAAAVLFALPSLGSASVLNLQFNSLPSAQGWTYNTSGPAESAIFTVDGTTLFQNSLGTGIGLGGTAFQYYTISNAVDLTSPFLIEVKARVLASETGDLGGFGFGVLTGTERFAVFIDTSTIWGGLTVLSTTIDNTTCHVYRLEVTPGVGHRVFVDGSLLGTGVPEAVALPNQLFFGDLTSGGNARAETTVFSFQNTPEPSSFVLIGVGLVGLSIVRRRRGIS